MENLEKELVLCFELQAPNHIVEDTVNEMFSISNARLLARWIHKLDESDKKRKTILSLPMRDTIWYLKVIQSNFVKNSLKNSLRIMALVERSPRGVRTIQVSLVEAEAISYEEHAKKFVCYSCLNPIGRCPQRPKFLKCKDFEPSDGLRLFCQQLGITLNLENCDQDCSSLNKSFSVTTDVRQCALCSFLGNSDSFRSCPNCEGVVYCCNTCLEEDWKESHHLWCEIFKKSMDMETLMADFPFSFVNATTARTFSRVAKKQFLQQHEVLGIRLWERECSETDRKMEDKSKSAKDGDSHDIYGLPTETLLINKPFPALHTPLTNWSGYYMLRGFPTNSIICVLLSFSLTLYHIITSCLPSEYAGLSLALQQTNTLIIHVIGAEKEIEMFEPFLECARLLQPVCLQIHLFGNEIPVQYAGTTKRDENLIFQIHRGLYHEIDHSFIPQPHTAVCFNGGLGAYKSFMPTIKLLLQRGVPLFYTDYGLASISYSSFALQKCNAGIVSEPKLNPFRSPFRITSLDQNLPRYSNAFITHIKPCSEEKNSSSVHD